MPLWRHLPWSSSAVAAPSSAPGRPGAEGSGRNAATWRKRLVALPTAVVSLVLILGGLPRLVASIVSAGGEPVIRKIQKQEPVTVEELADVISAQENGLFWVNDAAMEAPLGLAHLLTAEKLPRDDPQVAIHLQAALQALRSSLGRAPANPYPWTLLAYAEFLRAGNWTPEAVVALRLSLLTGPYEPRLLWSRLRLSLLAWENLTESDRLLVAQQIRFAWAQDPKDLGRLAVDLNRVNLVRAALEQVPNAPAAFEDVLKQVTG